MEFVLQVLEDVFQKSPAEAYRIMMQVHLNGRGIAGVYPWEVAETKVDTLADARPARRSSRCAPPSKKRELITVFSAALEVVLTIAYPRGGVAPARLSSRSSTCSTRSRTTPTASASSPRAAPICRGCAAISTPTSTNRSSRCKRGDEREPEQTAAFRRVLQTAVLHVQSAQRGEAQAGDILAAILQQPKTHAAQLLAEQGITRLDILEYISHGISKVPAPSAPATPRAGARGRRRRRRTRPPRAIRSRAYCVEPDRARAPGHARSADRPHATSCSARSKCSAGAARTTRCSSARPASARPRWPKGSPRACWPTMCRSALKDAEVFALDTGALLAGTRFRGDFEERFKAVIKALSARPKAILFIDEIHSTVGAGATTGGTMDLATLIKPILTAGELRVIGSTTFEEFKHIEKDRALARRLQKIAIDEPSIEETVRILAGLRSRYEEHHRVTYTDAALEAAAKLAARHLRDYRLPDSAIDLHRRSRRGHAARRAAEPAAASRSCDPADPAPAGPP